MTMSGGWSEVFEPGLRLWNEEQRRRMDDRHEVVAGAPPGEKFLRDGVIVLETPGTKPEPGVSTTEADLAVGAITAETDQVGPPPVSGE